MRKKAAFTLVEVLVASAILIMGVAVFLYGMNSAMRHAEYIASSQTALDAAQGEIERLAATAFNTLWQGAEFAQARNPNAGLCRGMGEDANCNSVLDVGEDLNGNGALDELVPGGRLSIRIKAADTANPANPSFINIHVAACWQYQGRRIGEDVNCNGRLDAGEDINANSWVDSPEMVSLQVVPRD